MFFVPFVLTALILFCWWGLLFAQGRQIGRRGSVVLVVIAGLAIAGLRSSKHGNATVAFAALALAAILGLLRALGASGRLASLAVGAEIIGLVAAIGAILTELE